MLPKLALGTPCFPDVVDKNSPFDFTLTQLDALTRAEEALDDGDRVSKISDSTPIFEALVQARMGITRSSDEFRCAASLLGPFENSGDHLIKEVTGNLREMYLALAAMEEKNLSYFDESADKPHDIRNRAKFSADLLLHKEKAFEGLMTASSMGTYALVLVPHNDKNSSEPLNRLRITSTQRARLVTTIEQLFPTATVKYSTLDESSLSYPQMCARLIYLVLKQPYKTSDER
jgi:hypothetical protein